MKVKKKSKSAEKRYRYVVAVQETVESTTAIESNRKMSWIELMGEAERRRVDGSLSFKAVSGVEMWCEAAYDRKKAIKVLE